MLMIKLLLFFLAILLPPIVIAIVPLFLVNWFLKKGRIRILKISTGVLTLLALIAVTFNILFPTAFPYVDWWIYGKTLSEVSEVYDEEWSNWGRSEYQRAPYSWVGYYYIRCNEDGRVYSMGTADSEP